MEGDLAVSAHGSLPATIDPFGYRITVTLRPEKQPEETLAALDDEIHRLQDAPPLLEAVERAVKQARALFAYGSESITNQAFWMGFTEMFDSYRWFSNYLDRLAAVTPEDVQRIAQAYLLPQKRVVGTYLPTDGKPEEGTA